MASSPLLPKEAEVIRSLDKLKREPITTDGMQDSILAPIYGLLMTVPPGDDGILHWFCDKAKPVVNEAAVFLLRLYAYAENPRVEVWKTKLGGVLHGCCGCVQSFNDAKTTSRATYFGAFSKPTLDTFFATLENWEVGTVLEALTEAGITAGSTKSLSDVPTAVLYHMLTTIPVFFENAEILRILQDNPPAFISLGWPVEVPPGVLLLLFHEKAEVRTWAQQQVVGCSPILENKFFEGYEVVLHAIIASLASSPDSQPSKPKKSNANSLRNFFTMSPPALWSGVHGFLRLLPSTIFNSQRRTARQFCQAIVAHLHDTGTQFPDVLRAFVYLVKKLGKSLWEGEDPDYPQVVFDSVKDNPAFIHLIQDTDPRNTQQPWFLEWFHSYISSLWELPIFEDMLRKLVGFMCEELQHERFEDKRPMIMASILSTLHAILHSAKTDKNLQTKVHSAVVQVLDIHADIIVNVALSSNRKDITWQKPRAAARQLLGYALADDASSAERTIFQLSDILQQSMSSRDEKRKYDLRAPLLHTQMWKKMYETVDVEDSEGVALLISLLAPSAYLDTLSSEAFNPQSLPTDTRKVFSTVIQSINSGLKTMRGGFLDMITQYTNSASCTPKAVQSMIRGSRGSDMVKHIVALLLSPVEELQVAAQTLLGQAYDVDVRSDCFRALLLHLPVPSLNGLAAIVSLFNDCAPLFPEACSIAKSVVRCMTDVIEVLPNGHDGLLFDETFGAVPDGVRPHTRLPTLWRLMCSAITVIFRRTPIWSKYYDPEVMIDWMRDALIFARDLLAQRRTFESASTSVVQKSKMTMVSPRKPSQTGRQMLENLQTVLTESIRWLRLTDMELLHQSSNLVQSLMDCFRETDIRPSSDALTKLEKFLDSARRQSSPDTQTRLSETHLSELTAALSFFNQEDDEEIQIIGEFKPGKGPSPFAALDRSDMVESSRQSGSQRKTSVEQKKLDGYLSTGTKSSVKTSISSSRVKPGVDVQAKKGAIRPNSLMTQARSQAAALTGRFADRHPKERTLVKLPQKVPDRMQPMIKDETSAAKVGLSEASSSSSEGSDEEDGAGGLASLVKLQKSPLIKKPAQRRTVKLMEPEFTGHNPALERIRKREEAQRAALRLKPDMRPLHRTILSWNYDHEGPEPPVVGSRPTYAQIAESFQSDKDYQETFEPLLTLECWNQLIKSKEEATPQSLLFRINSRQFIDDWLDLDVSVTDRPPDKWRLAETDVVLLRQSVGKKSVLAKVQSSRKMPQEIQATLRCLANVDAIDPGLHISTQWRLTRVFSLSTIAREFAALKALPYYDFYPEIMRPRPAVVPQMSTSQIQHAMKSHHVNEPQAVAILGSLKIEGFSLIQGPPGTGKTWTICGLVGAFLSSRIRPATVVHAGRSSAPTEKTSPKKVLVCAPSNAAIDEVAKRLKDGVRNSEGKLVVPNIVRVGADEAINISVKDISLDQLVDQRLDSDTKQSNAPSTSTISSLASLRAEMDALRNSRTAKLNEISNIRDNASRLKALEDELKAINAKRMTLSQQFNRLKDQQKSDFRTLDAARRKHRAEVLMEADVICATLSGAGHEVMQNLEFDMVVIDEAAQSIELSSLIPLKYRSKRCIMVGDPQQLPPTVLSPLANKYGYGQSLFVRLQKSRPEAVHLLSIQYRMHPDISRLPSKLFYEKRLQDGPGMDEKTAQPWHKHPLFGTYKFVNVSSGGEQQAHSGHSLVNRTECDVAVALYNRITSEFPKTDLDFRIGVITMYRAQLLELKKKFQTAFGVEVLNKVDFNTVDGFQGQEKDIIILSCVRAGPGVQSIGFLADQRRLNVAITRSRSSLFILGHAATLERSDEVWKEIVQDARGNSRMLNADVSTYRRPISAITGTPLRRVGNPPPPKISQSTQPPSDLKTPKEIVGAKSHMLPPVAGPSSTPIKEVVKEPPTTEIGKPINEVSPIPNIPRKRRNSEEEEKRPAPGLRPTSDSLELASAEPPKSRPPQIKKRPKEVSMFIPKKKNDLKRPATASDSNTSHGDAKRRLTGEHYG